MTKQIPVETVTQGCRNCDAETTQRVTKRFEDGSGYTKCEGCGKVTVNAAGSIPLRPIPHRNDRRNINTGSLEAEAHRVQAMETRRGAF